MTEQTENIEDIINYFAISLFGQNTVDEILWDLTKNCISKLAFEDCVIYLLDEQRNMLMQKAAYGPKNPKDFSIHEPIEIPMGKGIVGSVAYYGKPEIISDTSLDSRYIQDDTFRYSEIAVPIILNGKVIGVIDSEHSERNFFNDWHLRILNLIASLCANKIMWAKAAEEIEREQRMLRAAEQKFSELKLQALRSQMNPHFIFNALNAIQHFISSKDTSQALKYLSLFAKFIRKILQSSSQTYVTISEEIDLLTYYLELEKMRFEGRFDYSLEIDHSLDAQAYEIPVLLVQPFVERVFIDGLLKEDGGGVIAISFSSNQQQLQCKIKYRGNKTEARQTAAAEKTHHLLSSIQWQAVQERLALLNRLHHTNIRIDLSEDRIIIRIPAKLPGN